jgi:hypothetical protein
MLSFALVLAAHGRLFTAPPLAGPGAPPATSAAYYAPQMGAQQQRLRGVPAQQYYRYPAPEMRAEGSDGQPSFSGAASALPLFVTLPAYAYSSSGNYGDQGGGIFDTIVGGVFTVLCLGLAGFILKFAFDAASEVASQTGERMDRLGIGQDSGPVSKEPIYDDTDYSYKDLKKSVPNSRERVKKSKQFKADGTRLAPWMVIDEDKVEKLKKARAERIAKEKAGPSKNFWER